MCRVKKKGISNMRQKARQDSFLSCVCKVFQPLVVSICLPKHALPVLLLLLFSALSQKRYDCNTCCRWQTQTRWHPTEGAVTIIWREDCAIQQNTASALTGDCADVVARREVIAVAQIQLREHNQRLFKAWHTRAVSVPSSLPFEPLYRPVARVLCFCSWLLVHFL